MDDRNKVHVFQGRVTLTQGTLVIRGDKVVVSQDASGFQKGVASGGADGLARIRQKREGRNDYMEGEAERIEYDSATERAQFFNRAYVKSGQDEARGQYISYDGLKESYVVSSGPEGTVAKAGERSRQPRARGDPAEGKDRLAESRLFSGCGQDEGRQRVREAPLGKEILMTYENIIVETRGKTGLIQLHRPQQMNALNDALMDELGAALDEFETNDKIGAVVITGSEKVFAAGADIAAMKSWDYMDVYKSDYISRNWERVKTCRKPIIAAVAGYALGGGCELAMMCDIILAADNAQFGQPEIRLGIIPGAGGTQRLPRAVSKAKAMEMCLTARMMDAEEAERAGLVSRVVPANRLLDEALATAETIAGFSLPVVMMVKESVNRAYESALSEGLLFERRSFHATFALKDQKEGMAAFLEKRKANFENT